MYVHVTCSGTDVMIGHFMYVYLDIALNLLEKIFNGCIGIDKRGGVMLHQLTQQGAVGGIGWTDLSKTNLIAETVRNETEQSL